MMFEYLKDPKAIYHQSFRAIEAEADLTRFPDSLLPIVRRMIHACAMPAIAADIVWWGEPIQAAQEALAKGSPIVTDARMVKAGLMQKHFIDYPVHCILDDTNLTERADLEETTCSSSAIGLWRERWAGAIIAIGNAPTALFRLLEEITNGAPHPAAIFAFPIGFVGARESKEALMMANLDVPYITLRGRFGGSSLAAAALNALKEPS